MRKSLAVHTSSKSAEHYTPPAIVKAVVQVFGVIDLDPCADPGKLIPALRHYTKADDGLSQFWLAPAVYMNPPYGTEIGPWIAKLREELWAGRVSEAIALVPARTDTEWWERLTDEPSPTVCFVKGRLRFGNATNSAPFPSAIAYFGLDDAKFCEVFRQFGRIWQCKQHPTANASLLSPTLMAHWQASESPSILPFFAA